MRIRITYSLEGSWPRHCATTTIGENDIHGFGDSFELAEKRLLEKVREFLNSPPIPGPKEVEI